MAGVMLVLEYRYGVSAANSPAQVSTSLYSRSIPCLAQAKWISFCVRPRLSFLLIKFAIILSLKPQLLACLRSAASLMISISMRSSNFTICSIWLKNQRSILLSS